MVWSRSARSVELSRMAGPHDVGAVVVAGRVSRAGYFVVSSRVIIPFFPILYIAYHDLLGLGRTRDGDLLVTRHAYGIGGILIAANDHEWAAYWLPREPQASRGAE